MPSNMVLRFRDLVAETIEEHRKSIKVHGHVWWGWWHKPGERVPRNEFLKFKDIISNDKYMWVYLADSGAMSLYKAKLIDIDFSEDEAPKECREIEKVPDYYFSQSYKAWFCMEKIIDAIPDELRSWAYSNPSDFTYESEISDYQDKRISSIDELLTHEHKTIYFIQPYDRKKHTEYIITQSETKGNVFDQHSNEINETVDKIITVIEDINQHCEYAGKKSKTPIWMPQYPKSMEKRLKYLSADESSFREFSSHIYILIVDGHQQVLKDQAIIRKSDFLMFAQKLVSKIKLIRCDMHHREISESEKRKLGDLYAEVCGKRILDSATSRIKFQVTLLKETFEMLKNEFEMVKNIVNKQSSSKQYDLVK